MSKVTFDYSKAASFIGENEVESMKKLALDAKEVLVKRTGAGNDFLGWIDLPVNYDKEEFARIKQAAAKIQSDSEVLVVIGIGGSYLGARAAIEFLRHSFYNIVDKSVRKTPEIYFVGNSISSTYIKHLVDVIGDRDFSINMISKSGTTTEPAIAFRVFKEMAEKKYGKEGAAKRIYATTDKARGSLKNLANEEGYESFVVPDDVGGRFSVLTAVGLLPIAVSGADIDKLMEGAAEGRKMALEAPFEENDAVKYAALRNILLRKGKVIEILANYEPSAHYVSEWWKQLYGESEGKDQKGIFPASVDLTTDLHSMGQFIQDGSRTMFETVLNIETSREEIIIGEEPVDLEKLVAGLTLDKLNDIFRSIMKKQVDKIDPIRSKFGKIQKEELSLEDCMHALEDYAKSHRQFSFRGLLGGAKSKTEVIVTFLAILELMKVGAILISQEEIFDDIQITSRIAA